MKIQFNDKKKPLIKIEDYEKLQRQEQLQNSNFQSSNDYNLQDSLNQRDLSFQLPYLNPMQTSLQAKNFPV